MFSWSIFITNFFCGLAGLAWKKGLNHVEEGNWMRAEARIKEIVEWQRETKEANILCKDGGKSLLNGIKKNTFV